jgi:hypothetical protein
VREIVAVTDFDMDLLMKWKTVFNFLFIYSHVHTLFESFLPPCSLLLPSPLHPTSLPGRIYFAFISIFVEEKT